MGLSLRVEWLEAPGIRDVVDRQAWARLVISGGSGEVYTRCLDRDTGQVREGVYGSVFPLARWIADSYWNILNEAPRVPRARPGRELAKYRGLTPWLRRHNVLTAREGFSLPDLSLARDGDHLVLWAFPDGPTCQARRPVRFLHQGVCRVSVEIVEGALHSFMEAVLERLREVDHHSVSALRQDWESVLRSREEERDLCERAARLGLDPYSSSDLTEADEEFLLGQIGRFPGALRGDLLDAADSLTRARSGSSWLNSLGGELRAAPPRISPVPGAPGGAVPAHEVGYRAARAVRKEQSLKAVESPVVGRLADAYGFPFQTEQVDSTPEYVDGLLASGTGRQPMIFGRDVPHADKAFRWSRALYMWRFGHASKSPRLISRSQGRLQRESRAFAAELLAPAAAIRAVLDSDVVDDDEIEELAGRFNVRPKLVRHQIENHGLAMLE